MQMSATERMSNMKTRKVLHIIQIHSIIQFVHGAAKKEYENMIWQQMILATSWLRLVIAWLLDGRIIGLHFRGMSLLRGLKYTNGTK